MKVAVRHAWSFSGVELMLYKEVGNGLQTVKPVRLELEEIKDYGHWHDATLKFSKPELLEFYQSLTEEMIKAGLLQRDLSRKEQDLIIKHRDDAIATRDRALGILEVRG